MKQKRFNYLVVLFAIALAGMFMISCSDDGGDSFASIPNDGRFEGTWKVTSGLGTGTELICSGSNYRLNYSGSDYDKGTFVFNLNEIKFTCTEYMESGSLYYDHWSDVVSYVLSGSSLKITWYQDDPMEPEYTYTFTKQ